MLIAALFSIVKTWLFFIAKTMFPILEPKYPTVGNRTNKLWYIHTMKYHSTIRRTNFWYRQKSIISFIPNSRKDKSNLQQWKTDQCLPWNWGSDLLPGTQGNLKVMEMFSILIWWWIQKWKHYQNSLICSLNSIHFTIGKLYRNKVGNLIQVSFSSTFENQTSNHKQSLVTVQEFHDPWPAAVSQYHILDGCHL
jgi:hypothetical protein